MCASYVQTSSPFSNKMPPPLHDYRPLSPPVSQTHSDKPDVKCVKYLDFNWVELIQIQKEEWKDRTDVFSPWKQGGNMNPKILLITFSPGSGPESFLLSVEVLHMNNNESVLITRGARGKDLKSWTGELKKKKLWLQIPAAIVSNFLVVSPLKPSPSQN